MQKFCFPSFFRECPQTYPQLQKNSIGTIFLLALGPVKPGLQLELQLSIYRGLGTFHPYEMVLPRREVQQIVNGDDYIYWSVTA